jgi:flagellar hook-length control protein FliK
MMIPAAAIAQAAVLTPPIEPNGQNAPIEEGSGELSFLNTLTLAFGATAGEGLPPEELAAEESLPEEFLAEQVPLEEAFAEEVPAQEIPAQEVLAETVPAQELPLAEVATEELPKLEVLPWEPPENELPHDAEALSPPEGEEATQAQEPPPAPDDALEAEPPAPELSTDAERAFWTATDLAESERNTGDRDGQERAAAGARADATPENEPAPSEAQRVVASTRLASFEPAPSANPPAASNSAQQAEGVEVAAAAPPSTADAEDARQGESETQGRPDERLADLSRLAPRQDAAEPAAPRLDPPLSSTPTSARETAGVSGELRALPELPVENESEILRQFRVLLHEGGGRARIQLHPPQLGGLDMRITITNDTVQLSVVADRGAVAELLSRHLPELRAALEAHGMQIDRAEVDVREQDDARDPRSRDSAADEHWDRGYREDGQHRPGDPSLPEHQLSPRHIALNTLGAVDVHV